MNISAIAFIVAGIVVIAGAFWFFQEGYQVDRQNDDAREGSLYEARLSDERDRIIVSDEHEETVFEYTIEEWQQWAQEHLDDQLAEPVVIGDMEQGPEHFSQFDAITLSPDRERVAFFVSTYAILTTISLVGVLDIETRDVVMVAESAPGGSGEMRWSPDGSYLAYTLDTARAHGDYLRIDDMSTYRESARLSEEDIITALDEDADLVFEAEYPQFRDLRWNEDEMTLLFMTNAASDDIQEGVEWGFRISAGQLYLDQ